MPTNSTKNENPTITIADNEYQLRTLARGGVAEVFVGEPTKDGKAITIKLLQTSHVDRKTIIERWQLEEAMLRALPNGNFPNLIEAGRWAGRPYLAYPFKQGRSLLQMLNTLQSLPNHATVACRITIDLLDNLTILHHHKIVHCDVSPENVIWDGLHSHLIDFGCAQSIADGQECSRWIGKASYLSPEQAKGANWDQRSDIYQTGIVLYQLLSGRRFNQGTDPASSRVWASRPKIPDLHRIPPALRTALHRMLLADPLERPSNAAQCATQLRAAAANL